MNYFNRFGRQWQVFVQAEGEYRTKAETLASSTYAFKQRAVPLSTVTNAIKQRFRVHDALQPLPRRSSQCDRSPGLQLARGHEGNGADLAETMPSEMGYDYAGMSFQEKKAQEGVSPAASSGCRCSSSSSSSPRSTKLDAAFRRAARHPIAIFGAYATLWAAAWKTHLRQIGRSCSSGIAQKRHPDRGVGEAGYERGTPLMEAALEGARMRLRPIIMTSFAFILGASARRATGSGAVARQVRAPR